MEYMNFTYILPLWDGCVLSQQAYRRQSGEMEGRRGGIVRAIQREESLRYSCRGSLSLRLQGLLLLHLSRYEFSRCRSARETSTSAALTCSIQPVQNAKREENGMETRMDGMNNNAIRLDTPCRMWSIGYPLPPERARS